MTYRIIKVKCTWMHDINILTEIYGCNSELLSWMPLVFEKGFIHLWNSILFVLGNPVANCPNSCFQLHTRRPSIQWAGGIEQSIILRFPLTAFTRARVGRIQFHKPQGLCSAFPVTFQSSFCVKLNHNSTTDNSKRWHYSVSHLP